MQYPVYKVNPTFYFFYCRALHSPPSLCHISIFSHPWYQSDSVLDDLVEMSPFSLCLLALFLLCILGFCCGSAGKEFACNAGDLGSIPGLGRSPGEEEGYPLQYSGLENSMDCIVHGGHKESDTTEGLSRSMFTVYSKVSILPKHYQPCDLGRKYI